eukprot:CAMPEP_0171803230 /NCGR_PEP_ID=MMETSP0991-20121206/73354_1 /TAXON_ID=483369 /ORGANISM="non described non described, Strain CCMP2098" /LENGTH=392 /DNA_ID=CAMNT_0012415297 /DNA_START=296 /DNA_END=1472 /DNA_ORIENTATION=+
MTLSASTQKQLRKGRLVMFSLSALSNVQMVSHLCASILLSSAMLPAVLSSEDKWVRIAIYESPFDAGATPTVEAGPGNLQPLVAELRAMGSRDPEGAGSDSVDASSLCAVFGPRRPDGSVVIGVAVVDTTLRTLKVFEFEDKSPDFGALEALVVQECVRELVVVTTLDGDHETSDNVPGAPAQQQPGHEYFACLQKLCLRCGILIATAPAASLSNHGGGDATSRLFLRHGGGPNPDGGGVGTEGSGREGGDSKAVCFSQTAHMKRARRAASVLITHLGLLSNESTPTISSSGGGGGEESGDESGNRSARNQAGTNGFTLLIGERSGLLQYDAAAERALMLFPSSRPTLAKSSHGSSSSGCGSASASAPRAVFAKTSVCAVVDRTVSCGGARR